MLGIKKIGARFGGFGGFGLPARQATACAMPVITSRGGALEKIAGNASLLVDSGSCGSSESAGTVLGNSGLRPRLVPAGFKRSTRFSFPT